MKLDSQEDKTLIILTGFSIQANYCKLCLHYITDSHFPKHTISFNIDFLPSRQAMVSIQFTEVWLQLMSIFIMIF